MLECFIVKKAYYSRAYYVGLQTRAVPPATPTKPLRRDHPLNLKIHVLDMLRRQAEDYEYECAYYALFDFASPSGRHVFPPKPRRRSSMPTPRLSFSPKDLDASPSVAASAERPRRGSVEDPQKPGGEEEKTPVSEPHL